MAVHKFTDAKIYMAQYDLSADHNVVSLEQGVDKLDRTVFGSTTHINMGGLFMVGAKGQGFTTFDTGEVEAVLSAQRAVADVPLSVMAQGGNAGDRAYFSKILTGDVSPFGGQVGEIDGFTWAASGSGGVPLVPGTVFAARAARTTSTTSSIYQLGAVGASQRVYAALHVFSASGTSPTLAVTVKSDNGVGFATPATQITLSTATGATSQFASAAGAITDDYWRVDWTIGGSSTPTFNFAVFVGIF